MQKFLIGCVVLSAIYALGLESGEALREKHIDPNGRTLIIAPHPDDEILGAGALMQAKIDTGEDVYIAMLTSGDAKEAHNPLESISYGYKREREAESVVASLGIPDDQLYLLNFPDGHLPELNTDQVVTSVYTHQNRTHHESYSPQSLYTQPRMLYLLQKILDEVQPTSIYVTGPEDKHPDHQAAFYATVEAIRQSTLVAEPDLYTFVIHGRYFAPGGTRNHDKFYLLQHYRTQYHFGGEYETFLNRFVDHPEAFRHVADLSPYQWDAWVESIER